MTWHPIGPGDSEVWIEAEEDKENKQETEEIIETEQETENESEKENSQNICSHPNPLDEKLAILFNEMP